MLAPWRSPLARALHRNRSLPHSRYLQLATVRPDGCPANRTVVFRGFLENTNQLKIITDARSEKAEQIRFLAKGEACWYFAQTREQFRLLGTLTLVGANDSEEPLQKARCQTWQELSDAARSQFAWAYPGKVRQGDEMFNVTAPNRTEPLPHFCLLLLDVYQVDHLELRGNPQNRYRYSLVKSSWSVEEINP